jgi:hypothetical protein
VLAAAVWYLRPQIAPAPTSIEAGPAKTAAKPAPAQAPRAVVAVAQSTPSQPGAPNPYAHKPTSSQVEFHVVGGLAVAYGDVLLGKPEPGFAANRGNAEVRPPQLWEKPEIPYAVSPELPNPARVQRAIDYFNQNTPVKFVPYQGQTDAVVFEVGTENCLSYLGKSGGLQPIRLTEQCRTHEILHEMMHALGFVHEQSRPDRDNYVEVLWQNIDPAYADQFAIVPDSFTDALRGAAFDYHSVMLYESNAFAVSTQLTTLQSTTAQSVSPTQDGLSPGDIARLNSLYNGSSQ